MSCRDQTEKPSERRVAHIAPPAPDNTVSLFQRPWVRIVYNTTFSGPHTSRCTSEPLRLRIIISHGCDCCVWDYGDSDIVWSIDGRTLLTSSLSPEGRRAERLLCELIQYRGINQLWWLQFCLWLAPRKKKKGFTHTFLRNDLDYCLYTLLLCFFRR